MATDGIRQRRGRTDNSLVHVYNTKELFAALQKAKEDEETLKSKMARLENENATLRSRVDSLRKATAPSIFKKIEGTDMPLGYGRRPLTPSTGDSNGHLQSNRVVLPSPTRTGQEGRLASLHPATNVYGLTRKIADLESQLSTMEKKRLQENARWRKKYDDLQEKWMKTRLCPNEEHTRSQLRSKSRVVRQSELPAQTQLADKLRLEIQELRDINKKLLLENGKLSHHLEMVKTASGSEDRQKTERDISRKYRDMLDRSERKIEELQRTNLKLHSMLKDVSCKLRSGSRAALFKDSFYVSTKNMT